jgi:hypothetical protein
MPLPTRPPLAEDLEQRVVECSDTLRSTSQATLKWRAGKAATQNQRIRCPFIKILPSSE